MHAKMALKKVVPNFEIWSCSLSQSNESSWFQLPSASSKKTAIIFESYLNQ